MERHRALDALSHLRVEEDELLQLFDALDARSRMFEGLAPGDEHGACAGILQNVAHLIDGLRRVDGNVDRAEAQDGEVCDGPFGPVLREQRDAVSRLDAKLGETERNVAHALDEEIGGDVQPLSFPLLVERVPFGVTANSVETEPRYSVERGRVFATDHGVVAHCYRCHVYSFSLISEIRGETATELRLERYRGTTSDE